MKLTIPDGWHEVPLKMFQEMSQLDKSEDGLLKIIDLLSILTDTDPELLKEIDAEHLEQLIDKIDFTSEFPSTEYKTDVTIDGVTYYLKRFSDLSLGEWIDLETYSEEPLNNIHKIFAILYSPNNEKYNTKTTDERAELFLEQMMISDVYGTLFFFSSIAQEFTRTLTVSLLNQINLN